MMLGPGKHGAQSRPRSLVELVKQATSPTLALLARSSEAVKEARLLAVHELEERGHENYLFFSTEDLWKASMSGKEG